MNVTYSLIEHAGSWIIGLICYDLHFETDPIIGDSQ